MLLPLPVNAIAFEAVLFDAIPQVWEVTVGLPEKLTEPFVAKIHGAFAVVLSTTAVACAPMLIVENPSTDAKYARCC
jgi:hypothetical protein